MSARDDGARAKARAIACDLGVTGKRLRRALPPVAPAADFRARLGLLLLQRENENHGEHGEHGEHRESW